MAVRIASIALGSVALGSIALGSVSPPPTLSSFISQSNTSNLSAGSSAANQVSLPLTSTGTYNFTVDWGDGMQDVITVWNQAEVTHTYAAPGIYTITIDGAITGWAFNNTGDRLKILDISNWGSLNLGNDGQYFWGCNNLDISATDILDLTGTQNCNRFFDNCHSLIFNSSIGQWNMSGVTNTNNFFRVALLFNQPLPWDMSSVLTAQSMLEFARDFDQSLASWVPSSCGNFALFLRNAGLSTPNYSATLIAWDALPSLQNGVGFHAGSSQYSAGAAATARANIISNFSWVFTDGGQAP